MKKIENKNEMERLKTKQTRNDTLIVLYIMTKLGKQENLQIGWTRLNVCWTQILVCQTMEATDTHFSSIPDIKPSFRDRLCLFRDKTTLWEKHKLPATEHPKVDKRLEFSRLRLQKKRFQRKH